jgi:oligopeptide transport system ATP-binding protein
VSDRLGSLPAEVVEGDAALLDVDDLVTVYPVRSPVLRRRVGELRAVDRVGFVLRRGETVGLVGESGSGKSTLARTIVGLTDAKSGSVRFEGVELLGATVSTRRRVRRDMQMIFQDPFASLNPRLIVRDIVAEAWRVNPGVVPKSRWNDEVRDLLALVGLDPDHAHRYPHQFSGGQRQRIGIARALALKPKLLICDEAVSALDMSVQAQVLNLLADLQHDLGLTYLFIAHDLSVVRHLSDHVMVMHRGRVVESGPTERLFTAPEHEYTKSLLRAVPVVRPWRRAS